MNKGNSMEQNEEKSIAFYIGGLCIGGAERVICNLAEYFYSEGYRVTMVTKVRDEKEYELNPGIRRIIADITPEEETGSRIRNLFARISKLKRIWKEVKPDVIVSFIRKNNLMAIASAAPLGIPVIVSVRSAPERELKGFGFKTISFLLFRQAAGVVLQTREAYNFFPGYIRAKAVVLPNSINPDFLKASEELTLATTINHDKKMTVYDRVPSSVKEKRIITVGRIDDNKNQRLLVEAYVKIADHYPDWSLELIGDGSGRQALEEYVSTLPCKDRISFTGAVDDVARRMSEASIFVLPSKIEGMPNALIEAMVMGIACISTDCPCGGPRDLIATDETNGILVPVDNVDAMAMALKRLITNDTLRQSMGDNARKIIATLHPDMVNKQWKNYIENVI
ncbi:MAG: glycosyltransferase [Lachnospiraceae bacterium]|nr:glycosyltransferase [Lachnospiraceae bacterium]